MKKSFILHLIFLLLLASTFANAQTKKVIVPDGWKKIEVCRITFYLPSEFEVEKLRGTDSCIERYRSKNILLSIDVLGYKLKESDIRTDLYSDEKEFSIVKTLIDNRKAKVMTYYETENSERRKDLPYNTTLFVPRMYKDCCNLTMWTNSRSAEDRETAKKIFETVRFEK